MKLRYYAQAGSLLLVSSAAWAQAQPVEAVSFQLPSSSVAAGSRNIPWELTVWGGHSQVDCTSRCNSSSTATGLRNVELAIWPVKKVRLSAKYDETLSFEDVHVPAYWVGALVEHGGRYLTNVNLGYRQLPGGIEQPMIQAEQVVFFPGRVNLGKAGGWIGARSDGRTEWLGYAGAGVRVSERIKFEPTVFHSRSGIQEEQDTRILLFTEYAKPEAWTIGIGAALGRATIVDRDDISNSSVSDAFLLATTRLQGQTLRLLVRHGQTRNFNTVTTVAVGFTVGRRP